MNRKSISTLHCNYVVWSIKNVSLFKLNTIFLKQSTYWDNKILKLPFSINIVKRMK